MARRARLPCTGLFLWLTGAAGTAYFAVVTRCLGFGCSELMEGPYWSATMRLTPDHSMAATAVLNTGGNLGGIVVIPRNCGTIGEPSVARNIRAWRGSIARRGRAWFWIDIAGPGAQSQEVRI